MSMFICIMNLTYPMQYFQEQKMSDEMREGKIRSFYQPQREKK